MKMYLILLAASVCFSTATHAKRMAAVPLHPKQAVRICYQLDKTFSLSAPCEIDFQNKTFTIVLNWKMRPRTASDLADLACKFVSGWALSGTSDPNTPWRLFVYRFKTKTNPIVCGLASKLPPMRTKQ